MDVLLATILLLAASSPAVYILGKRNVKASGLTLLLVIAISMALVLSTYRDVSLRGEHLECYYWIPILGSPLTLFTDGVGLLMAATALTIMFSSTLYSLEYMRNKGSLAEYYSLMTLLAAGVVGIFLTSNLLIFYFCWEFMLVPSYFILGGWGERRSYSAAFKFFVFTHAGAVAILLGIGATYFLTGTLDMLQARTLISSAPKDTLFWIFLAYLLGFIVKMAIVPLHMWLPDAYTSAPSSSAAFLSAIVDQASYYVFMRVLIYILTPPAVLNWPPALSVFSAITMTVGNIFALAQRNVKRMVAYVCVADIGYNLIAITSVTPLGVMGNLYFFFVGGMTTALAFMAVGVMNRLGIENLDDFSGVGKEMPLTSFALTTAALSFSGVPPFAGFIAKYLVFTAAIEAGMAWLAVVGVLNSVLQSAYLLRLIHYMYGKKSRRLGLKEPKGILIPIYIAVILIVVLGLYPSLALDLIQPAASQLSVLTP